MVLKRVEIFGFKSFPDRTILDFPSGITAIVGSNGCGKSNISDAIRWVLGEQSAKSLRGDHMEDLIFSGTATRKPLNFAEVTLTFDNARGLFPLAFAEVSIGRRLYRTGESHYLINKQESRLRDVHDLIMDSGIGRRAHSIIEQGKIDEIVTAKPEERRQIIEEAAGIAKYRSRRREALRKLETTREGLRRVDDLIAEMDRQEGSLGRAAKKAERFREIESELRTLELGYSAAKRARLSQTLENITREKTEIADRLTALERDLAAASLESETAHAECNASRERQKRDGESLFEAERAFSAAESRLHEMKERRADDERSLERISDEISRLAERIAEAEKSLAETHAAVAELKTEMESAASSKSEADRLHDNARANFDSLRAEIESASREHRERSQELAKAESEMSFIETSQTDLARAIAEHAAKIVRAQKEEEDLKRELTVTRDEAEGLTIERDALLGQEAAFEEDRAALFADRDRLNHEKNSIEREAAVAASRLAAAAHPLSENSIASIAFDEAHLAAFASAFGDALRGIIDANTQSAALLPGIPVFTSSTFAPTWTPREHLRALRSFLPADAPQVTHLILAGWYLVEDSSEAEQILPLLDERERVVTRSGDVHFPFGGLRKPRSAAADETLVGRESIERAIDRLAAESISIDERMSLISVEARRIEGVIAEVRRRVREIDSRRSELLGRAETLEKRIAAGPIAAILMEGERLENEKSRRQNRVAELAERATEFSGVIAGIAARLAELQAAREASGAELEECRARVNTAAVEESRAVERLRAKENDAARLDSWLDDSRRTNDRYQTMRDEIIARRERLNLSIAETESLVAAAALTLDDRRNAFRASESESISATRRLEETESAVRGLMRARETATAELHAKDMESVRASGEITLIIDRIREKYAMEIPEEVTEVPEGAEARIEELREAISKISGVNFAAAEELTEVSQRLEFYRTQRNDLGAAEAGLIEVVGDIDRRTLSIFNETFRAVNNNFGLLFNRLFGAREDAQGSAELVLLDPENPLESGIDIIAMPPGKKPQTISLLSGGEKALTAVSLLFAVFLVRPSPFAVLDELDAPLDEANVGKYAQLLKEFSQRSQFIIVTHNKRTMEAADTMYGVTQQEKGISTILGMRLEEAESNVTEIREAVAA